MHLHDHFQLLLLLHHQMRHQDCHREGQHTRDCCRQGQYSRPGLLVGYQFQRCRLQLGLVGCQLQVGLVGCQLQLEVGQEVRVEGVGLGYSGRVGAGHLNQSPN